MKNKQSSRTQNAQNKQNETSNKTSNRTSDKGGCCGKKTSETKDRG